MPSRNSSISDDHEKAKLRYDLLLGALNYSEHRQNSYNNKFVEIEIQAASIITGIVGASALLDKPETEALKIFALGSGLLIVSILSGILSIHYLREFWAQRMKTNRFIFNVWRQFLLSGGDYDQASADCDKAAGLANIVESPSWPHRLQSFSLVVGLIILGYGVLKVIFK